MRWFKLILVLVLANSVGLAVAPAQDRIPSNLYLLHVTVTDAATRPLVGAEVRLDDEVAGLTDVTGQYYLARKPLPEGPHTLSASMPGFETASRPVARLYEISQSKTASGAALTIKLSKRQPTPPMGVERGPLPQANSGCVSVFYATDRADTGNKNPVLQYSGERSPAGKIEYGIAVVTIPSTHVSAELESPSWLHFEFNPDPDKHIVLDSVKSLERDPFYVELAAAVASSPGKEAVVFIHGYNNSFENAARQTAQLVRDANFLGTPILYSWPSKNKLLAYTEDEDTVTWTAFHLRDFLEELAQRAHASKIHLIAHSMGNRALASALQMIASRRDLKAAPPFEQVVLAAPDIGADTLDLFAHEFRPLAKRLTLYASENDDALMLSKFIHGAVRAGQKSAYLYVADGIDTIDASLVRTDFLGHDYFANSGSIIDDIQKILTNEDPPERRNLTSAKIQEKPYWIMPKLSR